MQQMEQRTIPAAGAAPSLPAGYLADQEGTSHSSAMSVARPATAGCLPHRQRVLQCQPSRQQLSWGMQEELSQERRCSQRRWTKGVLPLGGQMLWGTITPKEAQEDGASGHPARLSILPAWETS